MTLFRPAWTLCWYVLREFFVAFGLAFLAVTIFLLLLIAFNMAAELGDFGVGFTEILMLTPFILPRVMTQAFPLATLIATIMVFGRLSAESEILAAQAGGAALRRFVWPLLFCAIVISVVSLWLQDAGMRWGNDTIRTQVLKLNKPESFIKTMDKPGGGLGIHPDANKFTRIILLPLITKEGKIMRPVQIIDFLAGKIMQTVLADDHEFFAEDESKGPTDQVLSVTLTNVKTYSDQFNMADQIVLRIPLPDIGAMIPIGNKRSDKSWLENRADALKLARDEHRRWEFMLRRASDYGALAASGSPLDPAAPALVANSWNDTKLHIESIVGQGGATDRMRKDKNEFHQKIALALLPFSMIFLGIGLGLMVKKSSRLIGFLMGISMYVLLYYPLNIIAKSLSNSGNWDKMAKYCPPQYLPNILFLFMGYIIWRAYEHGFHFSIFSEPEVEPEAEGMPNSRAQPGSAAAAFANDSLDSKVERTPGAIRKRGFRRALFALLMPVMGAIVWLIRFIVMTVIWNILQAFYWVLMHIVRIPILIFRRTTDIYIGTSFFVPLVIIVLCGAGLVVVFDVIEHLSEIVDGIRYCAEPLTSLPVRTPFEALRDVIVLYGIQSLEFTLDFLPLEVLIAGMLCAMVLVRNQEHLILKSSGIKLQRAMRPAILLAFAVCAMVSVVRELWMPDLMLHRDFLKPQVYHKPPQPSALALYTLDENKKPLLFEMGSYNFASKQGRELHVYLLGEQKNNRVPQLFADVVKWNAERDGWDLFTDPAVQEAKQLEQAAAGPFGGKSKAPEKDKDKPKDKTKEKVVAKDLIPGGQRVDDEGGDAPDLVATPVPGVIPTITKHKTPIAFWQGPINPKFIDNDRLGAKVMRLNELKRLSEFKPELRVEWYKRVSEFAMGFILLWCALPLMLSDSKNAVTSIAYSILLAAIYYASCQVANKLGIRGTEFNIASQLYKVPVWAPVVPHCVYFVIGFIQFYFRMET